MELILDANVLFSALIKNSLTTELLFEENLAPYTPKFVVQEFLKYEDLILKKTSRTRQEFIQIQHALIEVIQVVSKEKYARCMEKAKKISPDPKDVSYFALALTLKCPIWSNDHRLKKQDEVKIYSTKEVLGMA